MRVPDCHSYLAYEPRHVGGRGAIIVDDEVRVHRRDRGPAEAHSLAARRLDQTSGGVAPRIHEDAAAAGQAERLARLAGLQVVLHLGPDPHRVAFADPKDSLDDDTALSKAARTIAPVDVGALEERQPMPGHEQRHGLDDLPDPALARPSVHGERASEGTRDTDTPRHPRDALVERLLHQEREDRACPGAQGASPDRVMLEVAAEQQHRPVVTRVRHEQVRSLPYHRVGDLLLAHDLGDARQIGHRVRHDVERRRSADSEGRMARHGFGGPHLTGDGSGKARPRPRYGHAGAPPASARSARARTISGPIAVTSPAPIVMMRSSPRSRVAKYALMSARCGKYASVAWGSWTSTASTIVLPETPGTGVSPAL